MLAIDLDEHVDFRVYMPRLAEWFWRELRGLARAVPAKPFGMPFGPATVLMGFPLWGDEYIRRFTALCLPTLMAPRNRAALTNRSLFVIFTDEESFTGLWNLAKDMTNAGLKTVVYQIDTAVTAKLADPKYPLNKYWLLGACQQLAIQMAGRWGMAYHALHPDHVHQDGYFENMWRLAEEHPGGSIAQTTISADIHAAIPDLEAFRAEDKALVIPGRELGDLGWRHLHKQTQMNVMNQLDITNDLPHSHFLMWRGKERLYAFCCHMNLVYLPPERAAIAPIHLYNAIDTMIPHYVGPEVYVPDDQDGMTVIEVSDEKKGASDRRVTFGEWAVQCWDTVHGQDVWMPFFECVCEIPIHEHPGWQDDDLIRKQHANLVEALKRVKEPALEALKAEAERREKVKAEKAAAVVPVKSARAQRRLQAKADKRMAQEAERQARRASIAAENTMNYLPAAD